MTYTSLVCNEFVCAVSVDVVQRGNPIDRVVQYLVACSGLRVNCVLVCGISFKCSTANYRVYVV